jgi:hypothetical protein
MKAVFGRGRHAACRQSIAAAARPYEAVFATAASAWRGEEDQPYSEPRNPMPPRGDLPGPARFVGEVTDRLASFEYKG